MSHSIIEAAKAIIPHLTELLGEQAEPVKQQLETLLAKEADKAQVEIEIIELFSNYEAARAWMNERLNGGQEATKGRTLSFSELAGNQGEVKGAKYYKCPQCDYHWTRTLDWQTPPQCPIHDCDLIEDD